MKLIEEIYNELNILAGNISDCKVVCAIDMADYAKIFKIIELQRSKHFSIYSNFFYDEKFNIYHPKFGEVMLFASKELYKYKLKFKLLCIDRKDICLYSAKDLITIVKQKLFDTLINEMIDSEFEEVLSK